MHRFTAVIEIIGINPFVYVPDRILIAIFGKAGRKKGPIPVCGVVNGVAFKQTLVRYSGSWRLYINTAMLKDSPRRIGEQIKLALEYDDEDRTIAMHPRLQTALKATPEAQSVFDSLPASRRKEIVRYIAGLKSEQSIDRNIERAINFLLGKERFIGRDNP